ncbi:MAG TPA: PhoH family protein [Desulfurobacteriaceae bacterium]|nr:PhoH family protein [Desulfurobacteriaceae bacterium]
MIKIHLELSPEDLYCLFGKGDENIKKLANILDLKIGTRGSEVLIEGDKDKELIAYNFIKDLESLFKSGKKPTQEDIRLYLSQIDQKEGIKEKLEYKEIIKTYRGRIISPKTSQQQKYVEEIEKNDITFGVGPAGTGKTYLAVAMAVKYLKEGKVARIILTRPAVEAGEKLGFLPGTLEEKISPYLRPLYDALFEMLDPDKVQTLLDRNIIEIAPLAFMRGRTLNDAFIILDEAQNTTREQMKMFLTRLGFGSKVVVTGDISQIDLPKKEESGLIEAIKILRGIKGISIIQFSRKDVVRHKLVQEIIKAYEEWEGKNK